MTNQSQQTQFPPHNSETKTTHDHKTSPQIPIEIVSEEEMALLEAALVAATRSSLCSSSSQLFQRNTRSIGSITSLSKRRLFSGGAEVETGSRKLGDIEDLLGGTHKRNRGRSTESFLHQFRRKRGLSVTDITSTEWCEKQMEFFLLSGMPESTKAMKAGRACTKAMKAGRARHAVLKVEVVKRVEVRVLSVEDVWALKFMNFIVGVNQLLLDGLTRELPLVAFVEGVWTVGVIDEIRMPLSETKRNPTLVDTKTRAQASLPSEPQRRNGRLQLMWYKYMWDKLAADKFPSRQFLEFFSLNPHYILSEEIREHTTKSGFPAETLNDLLRCFQNKCCSLPLAQDQLLLRYEFQEDQSVLDEDQFAYDSDWLKGQIKCCLEFWLGEREASYAPKEERWKCRFCKYVSECKVNTTPDSSPK